jgi:uncharacterized coiled-coil protein SlyX
MLQARVVELETLYMHLQRTVAELDQAALAQHKRIESLERTVRALGEELTRLVGSLREERNLADERPPHY